MYEYSMIVVRDLLNSVARGRLQYVVSLHVQPAACMEELGHIYVCGSCR